MWSQTRQTSFLLQFPLCFCIPKQRSFAGTLATPTAARVPLTPTSRWTPQSRKCPSCHQGFFKFSGSSRNVEFAVGREVTAALSYSSVGGCSFSAPLTMCRCLAVPSPPPRSTERHCMTWGSTRRVRNLISSLPSLKTESLGGLNTDWIRMHRKVFTQIVFLLLAHLLSNWALQKWLQHFQLVNDYICHYAIVF